MSRDKAIDGRAMQSSLDQDALRQDMINSARILRSHALSTGKLGVTGFCWGGATSNFLATHLGGQLDAAAPFYGRTPALEEVNKIQAALLLQYAEEDAGVNATREEYEQALRANNVDFESYTYSGTVHGFHNNSTPRYQAEAAELAWQRTIEFFTARLRN